MEQELLIAQRATKIGKFAGPLSLGLVFKLPTKDHKRWGQPCDMKPDFDNLSKAVCDVMEKAGFFAVGDQQIARVEIVKLWCVASEAGVGIELREKKQPCGGQGC